MSGERARGSVSTTSGSHWWWMRGASIASWMFMPWSMTLRIVSSVMVMIRGPPGLPITMKGDPPRDTIVGLIEESGDFPGATALASPCTSPYMLGVPGFAVKSSISLLSRTPVPSATMPVPKLPFSV